MYADLPLTDYDMKWLTGSAWQCCVDLHNPLSLPLRHQRSALCDPDGCTLDSAEARKNPYARLPLQFLFLAYLLSAANAAFIF